MWGFSGLSQILYIYTVFCWCWRHLRVMGDSKIYVRCNWKERLMFGAQAQIQITLNMVPGCAKDRWDSKDGKFTHYFACFWYRKSSHRSVGVSKKGSVFTQGFLNWTFINIVWIFLILWPLQEITLHIHLWHHHWIHIRRWSIYTKFITTRMLVFLCDVY